VQVPVLADITFAGRPRKVMMWANRNGFMYVLDRTTGEFLLGKPFVKTNWNSGLDEKGRPLNVKSVAAEGTVIYPGNQGGTNWYSPSFSPRTGLFYIPSWMDTYATYIKRPVEYVEGQRFTGALPVMSVRMLQPGPLVNRRLPEEGYGAIQAFDPKTGDRRWVFNMSDMTESGVLSTASDLVFAGGRDGYFFALDAKTGSLLWKASVGGAVSAGPMTYAVGGKQHVAISAGNALLVYGLR
jgi:alcohol dehydrogenase (cytochrome c)